MLALRYLKREREREGEKCCVATALLVVKGHNGISTLKEPHFAYSLPFFSNFRLTKFPFSLCFPTLSSPQTTSLPPLSNPVPVKHSMGTSECYPSLKSLFNKVRGMVCHCGSENKYSRLDAKLGKKMIEVKRSSSGQSNFKSVDSIILRFPQFKEGLKNIKGVFEQYDEDSNGTIDLEELKKCLEKLQLHLKEKDIEDLFHSCDIDGSEGIQFNEFIVLLCLIYLLVIPSSSPLAVGSPELKATFDTIVEAFLFLDKNGDGQLNKKDMIKSLNDSYPWEKSPAHITKNRFKEMDWDKDGKVSFREFLFALISWVGIDTDEEITERAIDEEITDRS